MSRSSANHLKRLPIILAGSHISCVSTVLLPASGRTNNWDGIRRRLRSSPTLTSQAILKRTRKRLTREEERASNGTDQSWRNFHVREYDDDGYSHGLWRDAIGGSGSV